MREWAENYEECLRFAKDFIQEYTKQKIIFKEWDKKNKEDTEVIGCSEKYKGVYFVLKSCWSENFMYPCIFLQPNKNKGESRWLQVNGKIDDKYYYLNAPGRERREKFDNFRTNYKRKAENNRTFMLIPKKEAKQVLTEYLDMMIPCLGQENMENNFKSMLWEEACIAFFGVTEAEIPSEPDVFKNHSCEYSVTGRKYFCIYEPGEKQIEASNHYEFATRSGNKKTIEVHIEGCGNGNKQKIENFIAKCKANNLSYTIERGRLKDGRAEYVVDLKNKKPSELVDAMAKFYENTINIFKEVIGMTENNANNDDILKTIEKALKYNPQIVLTGAPGTGKTYSARHFVAKQLEGDDWEESRENDSKYLKEIIKKHTFPFSEKEAKEALGWKTGSFDEFRKDKRFAFVQFHSGYDYTDFVQGYKPRVDEADKTKMTFELTDGIFKRFCDAAKENQENDYYFIIDEINRADLSRVFGELFFGLEKDYRGTPMITQYGSTMIIPENVKIIGTMNDVDRGVETIDFALRRRFTWIEIKAESSAFFVKEPLQQKKMLALNEAIGNIPELGSEYEIGGSYFQGDMSEADIIEYRVKPLLNEYLRGKKKEKKDQILLELQTKSGFIFGIKEENNSGETGQ